MTHSHPRLSRSSAVTLVSLVVGLGFSGPVEGQSPCRDVLGAERAARQCVALSREGRCDAAKVACREAIDKCDSVPRYAKLLEGLDGRCDAVGPKLRPAERGVGAACQPGECALGLACAKGKCKVAPKTIRRLRSLHTSARTLLSLSPCDARQLLERACRVASLAELSPEVDRLARDLSLARATCPHYGGEHCSEGETRTLADGSEMVLVPEGKFLRGSDEEGVARGLDVCRQTYTAPHECSAEWFRRESPRKELEIGEFYIDKFEVSNARYRQCVDQDRCKAIDYGKCSIYNKDSGQWVVGGVPHPDLLKADHPVVCATWDEAARFCEWGGKRLPSEAEWEKAARGVDAREFPWGNAWSASQLNWGEATGFGSQDHFVTTAPIGSFPNAASPFGALDMSGNVWEWTLDYHDDDFYAKASSRDPVNTTVGPTRVMRGGSWSFAGNGARAAYRYFGDPRLRDDAVGFRCVATGAALQRLEVQPPDSPNPPTRIELK